MKSAEISQLNYDPSVRPNILLVIKEEDFYILQIFSLCPVTVLIFLKLFCCRI